ncbi:hypothetical protein T492DRAFT_1015650, partial [Pavlovales sp. CCMP2436]
MKMNPRARETQGEYGSAARARQQPLRATARTPPCWSTSSSRPQPRWSQARARVRHQPTVTNVWK